MWICLKAIVYYDFWHMWNIWSYKQCIILSNYMIASANLVFGYLSNCQLILFSFSLFRFWSRRVTYVSTSTGMCIWVKFRNHWNKIWIFMFKNYLLFRLLVVRDLVYFLVMLGGYCYIGLLCLIGFDLIWQLLMVYYCSLKVLHAWKIKNLVSVQLLSRA